MASLERASSISNDHELSHRDGELNANTTPSAHTPQWTKRRLTVLAACSLLQLPIWGFAMTYGIIQEYYQDNWTLEGSKGIAGIIGMISTGIMYLSMPFLFTLLGRRCTRYRRASAVAGALIASVSFLASSFSTQVWHLVATQGITSAVGCVLIYTPITLALSENFDTSNRSLALGIVLSAKSVVGTVCPFLLHHLLSNYSITSTLRIWAAITLAASVPCLFLSMHPPNFELDRASRPRSIPWPFLRHPAVYFHTIATLLQSSGHGIPQTYLISYASTVAVTPTSATLLLTLFNAPGIVASSVIGALSESRRFPLSASATAAVSALISAVAVFCFWGPASDGSNAMPLLSLFAIIYGFFAGGYSATWGGMVAEMEKEAAERNEALDAGVVYGLLNGARGAGYTAGGLLGVQLLKAGEGAKLGGAGYGTAYGPLILYTGLATVCGGCGVLKGVSRLMR